MCNEVLVFIIPEEVTNVDFVDDLDVVVTERHSEDVEFYVTGTVTVVKF